MKSSDFFDLLARFADRPIPATANRHIYIWVGDVEALLSKSPVGFIKKLDLHVLCKSITKSPLSDQAAGRVLTEAIEGWISRELSTSQHQRGLLVTGLDLLYRYRLSINSLTRLANENIMIILGLSALDLNFHPSRSMPGYVQFSPPSILKYLTSGIPEEAIVKEE